MKKIVWAPVVFYDSMGLLYFDSNGGFLKEDICYKNIPLYFEDREEAEAFLLAYTLSDYDRLEIIDISKLEIILENDKIINLDILDYTKEEILKYYGPDYL